MAFDPAQLLPPDIAPAVALAFLAFSFLTSAFTAAFGLGGGVAMLAGLGLVLPPVVLVPVHGCVQLGSNAGRALVQRAHIDWTIVLWFTLGSIPGSLLGAAVAVRLPEALFEALLGVFILYSVWASQPRVEGRGPVATFFAGTVLSGLGMVIAAHGPLVANFLRWMEDRRRLVATHAMLLTLSNGLKVGTFMLFGFAFGQYLPLVAGMIATGFLGTVVGTRFLDNLPDKLFRIGFRAVLTLFALEMLRSAFLG